MVSLLQKSYIIILSTRDGRAAAQKLLRSCAAPRRSAAAQAFSKRPARRSAAAQAFSERPARRSAAAQTFSERPARRSRAAAQRSKNLRRDSFRILFLNSIFALFKYVFRLFFVEIIKILVLNLLFCLKFKL